MTTYTTTNDNEKCQMPFRAACGCPQPATRIYEAGSVRTYWLVGRTTCCGEQSQEEQFYAEA